MHERNARTASAILTITAPDEIGLNARVATFLRNHHATLRDTHGARCHDGYAASFVFDATPAAVEMIDRAAKVELNGLAPRVLPRQPKPAQTPDALIWELSVLARDREGILAELSGVLNRLQINVVELASVRFYSPLCEDALFCVNMTVVLPANVPPFDLQETFASDIPAMRDWEVDLRKKVTLRRGETTVRKILRPFMSPASAVPVH